MTTGRVCAGVCVYYYWIVVVLIAILDFPSLDKSFAENVFTLISIL